ncbi:MAG: hypothetical protein AAFO07_34110, partial [Bacteroidota bacterium]
MNNYTITKQILIILIFLLPFYGNGQVFYSASGEVGILNTEQCQTKVLNNFSTLDYQIIDIAIHPDGFLLASRSNIFRVPSAQVQSWLISLDPNDASIQDTVLITSPGDFGPVTGLCCHKDGTIFLGGPGGIRQYDPNIGEYTDFLFQTSSSIGGDLVIQNDILYASLTSGKVISIDLNKALLEEKVVIDHRSQTGCNFSGLTILENQNELMIGASCELRNKSLYIIDTNQQIIIDSLCSDADFGTGRYHLTSSFEFRNNLDLLLDLDLDNSSGRTL